MIEVSQILEDLGALLHGTTTDKVTAPYNLLFRAGSQVLLDIDPPETKRRAQITNAIYDSIYEYPAPSDLKGRKVIGLYPQGYVDAMDGFTHIHGREFNLFHSLSSINVESRNGVKLLQVSRATGVGHTIDAMYDTSLWTLGGAGTNLFLDQLTYISGNGSLKFDVTGASTTTLTQTLTSPLDLTSYDNQGNFFLWVYMPDPALITNVILKWGSDSGNVFSRTVTAGHFEAFKTGWNLLRFDWNGATETGTVVPATVDYFQITITHTASDTDIRVDSLLLKLGTIYDLHYYSKYIWQNAAGTYIERPSLTTDLLVLDTESYSVFLAKLAELAAQQIQGEDSSVDLPYFRNMYKENKDLFAATYKSEALKKQAVYWSIPSRHHIRIR